MAAGVVFLVVFLLLHSRKGAHSGLVSQPQPVTNAVTTAQLPSPGTTVSAAAVLDKLDKWNAAHPNYHCIFTTAYPNGSVASKMDIYSYTNGTGGPTVRFHAQMFNPNLQFLGVRENGKLEFYFPRDKQLIEPDMARERFFTPTLPGTFTSVKDLLKLAKSSFAEASEDLEVATLVIDGTAVNMPTNVVYLSFRINSQGKLLGVDEQQKNQRSSSTMDYLSFDREAIKLEAPVLPVGITVVTNKSFIETLRDELKSQILKPLYSKTI